MTRKEYLLWKLERNLKGLSPKTCALLVELVKLLPKEPIEETMKGTHA
jgi:hypothetical protein